ncbi:uncharacterized protein LOC111923378 isoform X5 [Cyanistes caeruleus]|uniref:uncharacterized protein LOC111923378 isoform X5 n=1 Tax=Cyanistes caeruleus TaxID=156563 RepID=UPI000CDAE3D2|nr:uncharacterized protein LOC111923378 isoform X5 [Cyanistes caeruleus]
MKPELGMASTWQKTQEFYNWILESGDARTDPWPLVYSPLPVTLIFTSYLFMVALGPSYMRQRQRLELRALLLTYNLAMVALSSYMFYEFLVTSVLANYSYLCQPVDYSRSELGMRTPGGQGYSMVENVSILGKALTAVSCAAQQMARVCWWFFFSKIIELLDTVSFCNVNELSGLCLAGRRKLCPSLKLHSSLGCFLNSAQETRAGDFSARVPSWLYALQLVVRGQIRAWRTSLLYWDAELLCPHLHVWLLRPGRPGTADAQAPVVEALPDHPAAVPAGSHCCSFFLQPLHRVPIP